MSEEERYQGKLYRPKKQQQNGKNGITFKSVKDLWGDAMIIRSKEESDAEKLKLLKKLMYNENTPRKAKKFSNFVKTSYNLRGRETFINALYQSIHKTFATLVEDQNKAKEEKREALRKEKEKKEEAITCQPCREKEEPDDEENSGNDSVNSDDEVEKRKRKKDKKNKKKKKKRSGEVNLESVMKTIEESVVDFCDKVGPLVVESVKYAKQHEKLKDGSTLLTSYEVTLDDAQKELKRVKKKLK
eukprot:g291.t1